MHPHRSLTAATRSFNRLAARKSFFSQELAWARFYGRRAKRSARAHAKHASHKSLRSLGKALCLHTE